MTWPPGTLVDGVSEGGSGGGLDQLTGDVTAGPGAGSQVATIAGHAVTVGKMGQQTGPGVIGRVTASLGDVAFATIVAEQIASDAIITAKILDKNVTLAKIVDLTAARVLGSIAGGVPANLTITQVIDLIAGTPAAGDILYRDAAAWLRLAAGASGSLLQSNGVAAPSWVAVTTPGITKTRVRLTNAQMIALSTTPVQVVAGQGANTIITPVACRVYSDCSAGALGSGVGVSLRYTGIATELTNVSANAIFSNSVKTVTLIPVTVSQDPASTFVNVGIVIKGNADSSNGNIANYTVIELDWFSTLVTNTA